MIKAGILIVEDEAIIAMELESRLQGLGYEVTSVVNTVDKAIEKAEADKPDLILMDIPWSNPLKCLLLTNTLMGHLTGKKNEA
ncbi:response regulator [bacterium]|nr:response regulator [bacterium]